VITSRAADAFEHALTDRRASSGGTPADDVPPELLQVAGALRGLGRTAATGPSVEFTEQLRLRLMAEAEGLSAARAAAARAAERDADSAPHRPARIFTLGRGRKVVAATVASLVVGGAAAAVASSSAVPGQALYPVKRSIEDLRLAVAMSDAARGGTALALARERLDEAELLATSDGAAARGTLDEETVDRVAQSLADFDAMAFDGIELLQRDYTDGGDPASLAEIDTFLKETLPRLERLRVEVPAELHGLVDGLIDRLDEAALELDRTVASCGSVCTSLGIGGAGFGDVASSGHRRPAETPSPDQTVAGGISVLPGTPASGVTPSAPVTGDLGGAPEAGAGGGAVALEPLPDVEATAAVPGVNVGSGGATAGVQLPGVGVPGVSASPPGVGVVVPLEPTTTATTTTDSTCVELHISLCVD
jgi:Domain of unknown function (DUF5667)